MCTVTLNINEAEVRELNPSLTDMASINRWAQRVMDDFIASRRRSKEQLKPYTIEELHARIRESEADFAAGRYTPAEEVMREMDEEIAHMEAEERAYWAQSVERDLADMAEGKTAEYVSGDEFWSRFEQAAMKHYEDVPAEV